MKGLVCGIVKRGSSCEELSSDSRNGSDDGLNVWYEEEEKTKLKQIRPLRSYL